jgi:hypothetical protein
MSRLRTRREEPVSEDLFEKRRLAVALVGHRVRFHSQGDDAAPSTVVGVTLDGMVKITGFSGLFAPHLFRVIDNVPDRGRDGHR